MHMRVHLNLVSILHRFFETGLNSLWTDEATIKQTDTIAFFFHDESPHEVFEKRVNIPGFVRLL